MGNTSLRNIILVIHGGEIIHKKWLLFEVTPNLKAKNNLDWKVYPGIYTKIELFFGES